MPKNICRAVRTMALALLVCCMVLPALSQDNDLENGQVTGKFVTLPLRLQPDFGTGAPSTPLKTWNGTFTYKGTPYSYTMVGQNPTTGTSTTVKTFIVPIKVVITTGSTHTKYDPKHVLSNGNTVTANTVDSPIFDDTTSYTQGLVDVGTTQYVDAYQRANFWGIVQSQPNYHVLLGGPTLLAEQTLKPPAAKGKNGSPFGYKAAEVDIDWFDGKLQGILATFPQITPNTMVIFLTYNVYLTQNGSCCIGGYHTAIGVASGLQTYAEFTYVDHPGAFSQDVSALSHEVAEWVDDPYVNNYNTPCGILEVGDPLEGTANYGGHPYVLHGFTYNLQDLVMLPYFGAPLSTSVNGWLSFQDYPLSICSMGS
jgi:hypothetical protein